jgi:hypothetical protein
MVLIGTYTEHFIVSMVLIGTYIAFSCIFYMYERKTPIVFLRSWYMYTLEFSGFTCIHEFCIACTCFPHRVSMVSVHCKVYRSSASCIHKHLWFTRIIQCIHGILGTHTITWCVYMQSFVCSSSFRCIRPIVACIRGLCTHLMNVYAL